MLGIPREMLSFKTTLAPVPTVEVNVVYVKKSLILFVALLASKISAANVI
jgi:hypothetical protein